MKKIFLDTNFIIDYLIREEYKQICLQFLLDAKKGGYSFYISFLSIADFAYIARKMDSNQLSQHIETLVTIFNVIPNLKQQITEALKIDGNDFEDKVQYSSAIYANCNYIITRNKKDFSFSLIPVLSAEEFISEYL